VSGNSASPVCATMGTSMPSKQRHAVWRALVKGLTTTRSTFVKSDCMTWFRRRAWSGGGMGVETNKQKGHFSGGGCHVKRDKKKPIHPKKDGLRVRGGELVLRSKCKPQVRTKCSTTSLRHAMMHVTCLHFAFRTESAVQQCISFCRTL
jgi:hypothetical protein